MGFVLTFENGYTRVWSTPSSFITFVERSIDMDSRIALGTRIKEIKYVSRTVDICWRKKELEAHGITTVDSLYDWMMSGSYGWD